MLSRREFLKTATAASGLGLTGTLNALASRHQDSTGFFGVHEFIENNPEAVFIMRTDIDVKTNDEAKKSAGMEFGRSVLVPKENGVPITDIVAIKPNVTNISRNSTPKDNIEYRMGIVTDPIFVEGVIESLKELGVSGSQIHSVETWNLGNWGPLGYEDMIERTGSNMNDTLQTNVTSLPAEKVQWIDVPDGVWFRKLPYIWPINSSDSFLLNISKFKAHGMGLTLCAKNIQGTICQNYQEHCSRYDKTMSIDYDHVNPNAKEDIWDNYQRHVSDGIPRWDKPGSNGGILMETWASRCLDNNSVTTAGLHIIEGIYGRDGNGFLAGPNKGPYMDNEAWDYMSNVIIFGKNQFNVDIIGHKLGGHEPGNHGLFHMAIERGFSTKLNPADIPLYEWKNGQAERATIDDFDVTPLKTYFLQRDYNGQDEPYYHLLDEPFDYPAPTSVASPSDSRPQAMVLHQNHPNPFNPNTSIEYNIPRNGYVRLEVYNMRGQLEDVLVDNYRAKGSHMAVWNTTKHSSGIYIYRFRFGGLTETKKMTLIK